MPGPTGQWTEQVTLRLKEIYQKHSCAVIAAMLGAEFGAFFSKNAIIGKIHRLGLTKTDGAKAAPREKPKPAQRVTRAPPPRRHESDASLVTPFAFTPPIVDASPGHLTFEQLTDAICKYECSGQHDPALFKFCGQPVHQGRYCRAHARLCYQPNTPPRRSFGTAA